MQTFTIYDSQAKRVGEIEKDKQFFTEKVNESLIQQVLRMYAFNQRRGIASTKTRKEVKGGGKKPWKQKGTGRARAGTIRSPLWRGGGIVFGPHPRNFSYKLPQKIRKKAVGAILNVKFKNDQIVVVDKIQIKEAKTKEVMRILNAFNIKEKCLLLLESPNPELQRAGRNISHLSIKFSQNVNAAEIFYAKKLIIGKEAFEKLA